MGVHCILVHRLGHGVAVDRCGVLAKGEPVHRNCVCSSTLSTAGREDARDRTCTRLGLWARGQVGMD